MVLNKEEFLKSELGLLALSCINGAEHYLSEGTALTRRKSAYALCIAEWSAIKIAIKQFYDIDYYFIRDAKYYGIGTIDESDWLFKVERR